MNKSKLTIRMIVLLAALIFMNLIQCNNGLAAENEVVVSIPAFDVSINDEMIDSYSMEYPLIVYNDITYFPLTWSWCNELGLVSGFTHEDGLYIANYRSYNKPETEHIYRSNAYRKGDSYKAMLPTYPIVINGRQIDNSSEAYPLLNFNNITYFPLTWDFVIEEFAWDMSWHQDIGFKLSSQGRIAEYSPGEHYSTEYTFTIEDYRDYSIVQKVTDLWKMSSQPNEYGDYTHIGNGGYDTFYKLDYSSSTTTKIDSKDTLDRPYNSGAISSVRIDEEFTGEGTMLSYEDKDLLDLSEMVNKNETISHLYTDQYSVNNKQIYKMEVFFDVDGKEIPPPYTPRKTFVFIDNGNEVLEQIDWPINQFFSNVYPYGKTGVYLCSNGKYFTSSRYNNGCGLVQLINEDMSSETLNNRYEDWNSMVALGMDDAGNLYLRNTWFPENDFAFQYSGRVSPVNDGFFKLDLEGKLKKIYPFIEAETVTITPTGDVYFDANWKETIIHLQTGKVIKLN
jgi:hypothetical protein